MILIEKQCHHNTQAQCIPVFIENILIPNWKMILVARYFGSTPLKLPFGLATKETGDKIVWCVAQPKATIKKALQEETYDMLCAYIQARMDATSV
jgi:hypothetical protein